MVRRVCLLLGLVGCLGCAPSPKEAPSYSESSLKALLGAEIPPQASPAQVIVILDRHKFEHGRIYRGHQAPKWYGVLSAWVPIESSPPFKRTFQVDFRFSKDNKLLTYSIEKKLTGP
jgi:hypothetical protein